MTKKEKLQNLISLYCDDLPYYWEQEIWKKEYDPDEYEKWEESLSLADMEIVAKKIDSLDFKHYFKQLQDAIELPRKEIFEGEERTILDGVPCYDDWNIVSDPHFVITGSEGRPFYLVTVQKIDMD